MDLNVFQLLLLLKLSVPHLWPVETTSKNHMKFSDEVFDFREKDFLRISEQE